MLKINNMLDKMNIIGNEGDDLRDYLYSMSEPRRRIRRIRECSL